MVQIENLGRVIDDHPFFHGISPALRDLLVGCAANEAVEGGRYLFREGEGADKLYLVRSGGVAIEIYVPGRPAIVLQTLPAGEIVGWSWMTAPYRWTFDARAMGPTRLLSMDATCLRRKMDADPVLGYEIMRRFVPVMADRLHAARLQLLDVYGPPQGALS